MGHTPPSCENDTLPVPVKSPKSPLCCSSDGLREAVLLHQSLGERLDKPAELVNDDGTDDISCYIAESLEGILLMQMLRNN